MTSKNLDPGHKSPFLPPSKLQDRDFPRGNRLLVFGLSCHQPSTRSTVLPTWVPPLTLLAGDVTCGNQMRNNLFPSPSPGQSFFLIGHNIPNCLCLSGVPSQSISRYATYTGSSHRGPFIYRPVFITCNGTPRCRPQTSIVE